LDAAPWKAGPSKRSTVVKDPEVEGDDQHLGHPLDVFEQRLAGQVLGHLDVGRCRFQRVERPVSSRPEERDPSVGTEELPGWGSPP
jgi:hypothetical protein